MWSAVGSTAAASLIVASFLALFLHEDARIYGSLRVSDVITPVEALTALGLAACGLLLLALAGIARYGGPRTAGRG